MTDWLPITLVYLGGIAISLLLGYVVVRFAVFHALKSHTRWLEAGGTAADDERKRAAPVYEPRMGGAL
ncbi:hypothetical protein [Microbacterium allomyrinae]|uniref:Uncharacterized protein n=1 Tax=Microbacterium allomyrinae TaxID=2830666 RepID=A0A9X1S4C4_9MICO|nr:hypothetical protein [Microbacterium allomyrinae]MCC2034109.1 hypothetical protein [Microbacterium allomyrinae]